MPDVHGVYGFAYQEGAAVGCDVVEPGCGEYGHYVVDVFLADKFKQVFGLGPGGECPGVD